MADAKTGLPVGRSVPPRRPALRGGDADQGDGARLRPGEAAAARDRSLREGEDRPGDLRRDGRARPARRDHPRRIRRRRRLLRRLRPDRPRGRAGRQRLSLDDERAVVAGHAPDPRLRNGSAEAQVPAQARARRSDRLLRPHRGRTPAPTPARCGRGRRQSTAAIASRARRRGSPTRRSPTSSSSGRSRTPTTARSRASCSTRASRGCRRRRSRASCRCAPRSPARSCSTTSRSARTRCCPASPG